MTALFVHIFLSLLTWLECNQWRFCLSTKPRFLFRSARLSLGHIQWLTSHQFTRLYERVTLDNSRYLLWKVFVH